jgi:hypothetical protein
MSDQQLHVTPTTEKHTIACGWHGGLLGGAAVLKMYRCRTHRHNCCWCPLRLVLPIMPSINLYACMSVVSKCPNLNSKQPLECISWVWAGGWVAGCHGVKQSKAAHMAIKIKQAVRVW